MSSSCLTTNLPLTLPNDNDSIDLVFLARRYSCKARCGQRSPNHELSTVCLLVMSQNSQSIYDDLGCGEDSLIQLPEYTRQPQYGASSWSLHTTAPNSTPPFAASSYVRGEQDATFSLQLCQEFTRIGKNLNEESRHLGAILCDCESKDFRIRGLEYVWAGD